MVKRKRILIIAFVFLLTMSLIVGYKNLEALAETDKADSENAVTVLVTAEPGTTTGGTTTGGTSAGGTTTGGGSTGGTTTGGTSGGVTTGSVTQPGTSSGNQQNVGSGGGGTTNTPNNNVSPIVPTPRPTVESIAPVSEVGGAVVQSRGNVRIRATPSERGERVGMIPWGDQATVLDIDQTGRWLLIDYNGLEGWVLRTWFSVISGSLNGTIPGGSQGGVMTIGGTVESRGNVRIHVNPSEESERVGFIGWGERASLLDMTLDGRWLLIDYNGVQGWVSAAWFRAVR